MVEEVERERRGDEEREERDEGDRRAEARGWRVERQRRRTLDMKSPNAPPRAKPMTPEMSVLPTQDSMPDWTFGSSASSAIGFIVYCTSRRLRSSRSQLQGLRSQELDKGCICEGEALPPSPSRPPARSCRLFGRGSHRSGGRRGSSCSL